jgi:outer membrane protein OmpA-like peptidoglycan-associated protein
MNSGHGVSMRRISRCLAFMIAAGAVGLSLGGCPRRVETPAVSTVSPAAPEPAPIMSAPASPPPIAPEPPRVPPPAFMPNEALRDVHFAPGNVDVLKADVALLGALAVWLNANSNWLLLIEGHTDDRGTWQQNLTVSERRARSVMSVLVAKGVDATRLTTAAFGADRPICKDKTERCRAQNRRVHFLLSPR